MTDNTFPADADWLLCLILPPHLIYDTERGEHLGAGESVHVAAEDSSGGHATAGVEPVSESESDTESKPRLRQ